MNGERVTLSLGPKAAVSMSSKPKRMAARIARLVHRKIFAPLTACPRGSLGGCAM